MAVLAIVSALQPRAAPRPEQKPGANAIWVTGFGSITTRALGFRVWAGGASGLVTASAGVVTPPLPMSRCSPFLLGSPPVSAPRTFVANQLSSLCTCLLNLRSHHVISMASKSLQDTPMKRNYVPGTHATKPLLLQTATGAERHGRC